MSVSLSICAHYVYLGGNCVYLGKIVSIWKILGNVAGLNEELLILQRVYLGNFTGNIFPCVVVIVLVVVVLVVIVLLNLSSSSSSRSTTMQNLEAVALKLTELWPFWFGSKK